MSLESDFRNAAAKAKTLRPQSDDTLLKLYGLYKQGTAGDVQGEEPGMFDFVGTAKWGAWAEHRGKSKEAAMQAYIDLVAALAAKK